MTTIVTQTHLPRFQTRKDQRRHGGLLQTDRQEKIFGTYVSVNDTYVHTLIHTSV